jgi:hypothetical protein
MSSEVKQATTTTSTVKGRIPLDDSESLKMAYLLGVIDNLEEIKQRHIQSSVKAEVELIKSARAAWSVDQKTGARTLTVKSDAGRYHFSAQVTWSAVKWIAAASDESVLVVGSAQGMGGRKPTDNGKAVVATHPTVEISGRRMGDGLVRLDATDIPEFYLICQE